MAKAVVRSASRALGLLIVKCKAHRGFQHNIYTKLFDTMVWSVINYGSSIWGTRDFSCITAVQNRAMRFYMGVGKYTPNDAIQGDMGWRPPSVKQWTCVFRHWARIMSKFKECNLDLYTDLNNVLCKQNITQIEEFLLDKYIENWQNRILTQDMLVKNCGLINCLKTVMEVNYIYQKNYLIDIEVLLLNLDAE